MRTISNLSPLQEVYQEPTLGVSTMTTILTIRLLASGALPLQDQSQRNLREQGNQEEKASRQVEAIPTTWEDLGLKHFGHYPTVIRES